MAWLVFGLSAAFALAGAFSVAHGYPMIQVERGWAEVIAGSVALSGAGVIFAVGVVAVRLRQLQQSIQVVDVEAPAVTAELVQPAIAVIDPHPVKDIATDTLAAPFRGHESSNGALAPDGRAAAPDRGRPGRSANLDRPPVGPLPPPANPSARSVDQPALVASPGQPGFDRGRVPGSYGPRLGPDRDRGARAEPDRLSAETEPAFARVRRPSPPASTAGRALVEDRPAGPEIRFRGSMAPSLDNPDEPAAAAPVEPARMSAPLGPPAAMDADPGDPAVTEVGRYEAGGAAYVMYSDGTIHVESKAGGVMRFGSMTELKAYIERQERSAATEA